MWIEAQAAEFVFLAEENREVARELRIAADGLVERAAGIRDRIRPELWQGRSAEQRSIEAGDWYARLARDEDELETLAHALDNRAERAEDEADGLRRRARLMRFAEAADELGA